MSDKTAKRLAVVINIAKQLDKPIGLLKPGLEEMRLPPELRLNNKGSYLNQCILDAFKTFDLDPRFPVNWQVLTGLLAHVLFSKQRRGGLRIWNDEQLCKLLSCFATAERKHPNATDTAICIWLSKTGRYSSVGDQTLRRRLQDARNPARNSALAVVVDTMILKQKDEASAKNVAWTEADEQKARAECLQEILTDAHKFWPQ
jgi:hypothetical protein